MSLKARLAIVAESVNKNRRFEMWLEVEGSGSYQQLHGGDVLTLAQLNERAATPGLKVMQLDCAPRARDDR